MDKDLSLQSSCSNSLKYQMEEGMAFENFLLLSDSCCNFVRFPIVGCPNDRLLLLRHYSLVVFVDVE